MPYRLFNVYCVMSYSNGKADSPVAMVGGRYVVYGPNNQPTPLTSRQIAGAIDAAYRQCGKQIVSISVEPSPMGEEY